MSLRLAARMGSGNSISSAEAAAAARAAASSPMVEEGCAGIDVDPDAGGCAAAWAWPHTLLRSAALRGVCSGCADGLVLRLLAGMPLTPSDTPLAALAAPAAPLLAEAVPGASNIPGRPHVYPMPDNALLLLRRLHELLKVGARGAGMIGGRCLRSEGGQLLDLRAFLHASHTESRALLITPPPPPPRTTTLLSCSCWLTSCVRSAWRSRAPRTAPAATLPSPRTPRNASRRWVAVGGSWLAGRQAAVEYTANSNSQMCSKSAPALWAAAQPSVGRRLAAQCRDADCPLELSGPPGHCCRRASRAAARSCC